MQKNNVFLMMVIVMVSWQLMSMQTEPYLQFKVNERLSIVEAQEHGLSFYLPKKFFIGRNILESIPLSNVDKVRIAATFQQAAVNASNEKVWYTVDKKQFTALVSPIFHPKYDVMFLVTVRAGEE